MEHTSHKVVVVVSVLAVIALAGFGGWWAAGQKLQPPVSKTPVVTSGSTKMVEWNSLGSRQLLLKTAPLEYFNEPISVFKIGTIISGTYKGKFLAFASAETTSFSLSAMGDHSYVFFIADEKGNTVAWDSAFMEDPDDRCYDSSGVQGCERFYAMKNMLGFTDTLEKSLDFLPKEFTRSRYVTTVEGGAIFSTNIYNVKPIKILDSESMKGLQTIATTESGLSITKGQKIDMTKNLLSSVAVYYLMYPFGAVTELTPEPNFIDQNDVPKLTWNVGTTTVASYRYGQYAYGWQDCFDGISFEKIQNGLIRTGTTIDNDGVYEVDAQKYPTVYRCLHEKTKRYVYNDLTQKGQYIEDITYDAFLSTHPMFFWKHQFGDMIAFIRSDVVPAAEKAKPVVYLYPTKTEQVSVRVGPVGGFTKTDPEYGSGWVVKATPEGVITNTKDGAVYPYLFWEGGKEGVVETPKQGFVIARADIGATLDEKLSEFGLNTQERTDFLEFWVPKLSKAPYYFVTFISRAEIDRVAPMTVTPEPQSVIRVLMDYKPLIEPVTVDPLQIIKTAREGFTVVEWGGIVR